jgi:hypothetical protein
MCLCVGGGGGVWLCLLPACACVRACAFVRARMSRTSAQAPHRHTLREVKTRASTHASTVKLRARPPAVGRVSASGGSGGNMLTVVDRETVGDSGVQVERQQDREELMDGCCMTMQSDAGFRHGGRGDVAGDLLRCDGVWRCEIPPH